MISVKGIGLVVIFIVCLTGLWSLLFNKSPNRCEMTYMYQPPEYINVQLSQPFYRPYKLYAYGEGTYAQSLIHNEYHGQPILFIPGNGGSHKQVRSLASVALVMSYKSNSHEHFNYFSLDLNEELSAFDGEKLEAQTKFLFLSIKRIFTLYPASTNTKLILVGHSLGGIVAKGLLTKSYFKPYLERIIFLVTLATPHKGPPIAFDLRTRNFYFDINSKFLEQRNASLKNLNIVSIGGANDDKLVREDLISLNTDYEFDRSLLISGINDVWVSADHLCIVWCRQLTIKLNKIFFDLMKPQDSSNTILSSSLIDSPERRQEIIDFHLLKRYSTKSFVHSSSLSTTSNTKEESKILEHKKQMNMEVVYSKTANWNLYDDQRMIRLNSSKIIEHKIHLIPLKVRESISLIFEGQYKPGMFSVCRALMVDGNTICEANGYNLHDYITLVPSPFSGVDRYQLLIRSTEFISDIYTHLVIQLSPSSSSAFILIDRFTTSLRRQDIQMPSPLMSLISGPQTVFEKFVSQEQMFFNLTFNNFHYIWQSYSLAVVTTTCYRANSGFSGFGQYHKPEVNLMEYMWNFSPIKYSSLNTTLLRNSNDELSSNNLQLFLEPNCGFRVTVQYSIPSSVAQIYRHYTPFLILISISTVMLIVGIMLFNPLLIFAIPNREYSEFLKSLPKLNQCQRAMEDKCCVIFMNVFEVMTSSRYFLYFYTQILVYVALCIGLSHFFEISQDITNLQRLSPICILTLVTVLFFFSYSMIFIFSALIHHLSNNFSITFNTFSRKMKILGFILDWKVVKIFLEMKWKMLYAGGCLLLFGILLFSFFQANFYLVHMLFTMLMLSRFIDLNYWESRIGRTTTTSYIRSIYPVVYSLQLITALLHIPETIDTLPLVLSGKRFETLEWILTSLPSILESIFYFSFYLILLYLPMKIDVRLEKVEFPILLPRKFFFPAIIIGAFLNILIGSLALRFINYNILLIFIIILLHRFDLYRLVDENRVKQD